MPSPHSRPVLRRVETIVVPDERHGKVLVLRDTQGVTSAHAAIPPALIPIVARFDGSRTCEQIAREVSAETGESVSVELVVRLAEELDRTLFLEGKRFLGALATIETEFAEASVRPASHAGGAYHDDPNALRKYLDHDCLGAARTNGASKKAHGRLAALIAPHIDPWRGAVNYGHAYGALARALRAQDTTTFILLGTSHAPMREPFALCNKSFATPLGALPPDAAALAALAKAAPFDAYADQLNHKREHSLEFQAVFLKHLLGEREATIVPILAGLGEHQARGSDPAKDASVARFMDALGEIIATRNAVVVAGADLAHIGPRFGDARPTGDELATLDATDRASLDRALASDAGGFWEHVARDLDTRRVCGLAPIWSLLRTLPASARGELLRYEQTVDANDGSVVSHAALAYFG